jgi:hypothetical protein
VAYYEDLAGPVFDEVVGSSTGLTIEGTASPVEAVAEAGIVKGYSDGTFRPGEWIRRDHVAVLISRWLGLDEVATGPFTDLDVSPYAGHINALYGLGVVRGTTSTTFSPLDDIRRDQAASLIYRAWTLE